MVGLKDTIAALKRRTAAFGPEAGKGRLVEFASPAANPGALRMHVYAPPNLRAGAPLVVVLHGCTQSAEAYAEGSGWIDLAERFGFVVLAPEQAQANNPNRCFNWFVPVDITRTGGEAASIAEMVRSTIATYGLDREQVFVTGLSAGGAMASVMLATYPEMFAGGGIIAGLPYGVARSMPEAFSAMGQGSRESARELGDRVRSASRHAGPWPRVSIWHGIQDRTVTFGAAESLARQWCSVHDIDGPGQEAMSDSGRRYQAWASGDGHAVVELHSIPGMGHGVPLRSKGDAGYGTPGPYLLEVGVSSSWELASGWGIASDLSANRKRDDAVLEPEILDDVRAPPDDRAAARDQVQQDESPVLKIINDALRKAGLLR